MSVPTRPEVRRPRRRALLWTPGEIPAPGQLLDWRDGRHFDRRATDDHA
ncbi:hypothetical protein ABT275_33705 [Streptomyces sp. NPDC001185]